MAAASPPPPPPPPPPPDATALLVLAVEVAEKQVELVAADLMLGQMPKYEKMMIVSYAQTPTFDTPFGAPL